MRLKSKPTPWPLPLPLPHPRASSPARWVQPHPLQADKEFLLSQDEYIKKGEKPPEWKFPHIVIESSLGEKVYLGPTRFSPPTEAETAKRQQAVSELHWAIKLNPTSVELREKLANTLVRLERYDEAIKECEAITKLDPMKIPAGVIAHRLYGMGQLDRAKTLIEQTIQKKASIDTLNYEFNLPVLGSIYVDTAIASKRLKHLRRLMYSKRS